MKRQRNSYSVKEKQKAIELAYRTSNTYAANYYSLDLTMLGSENHLIYDSEDNGSDDNVVESDKGDEEFDEDERFDKDEGFNKNKGFDKDKEPNQDEDFDESKESDNNKKSDKNFNEDKNVDEY
ncbi:3288_t:CDS:2, partial [Gigaspora margarita]